jgi:hypothetical protein
MTNRKIKKKLTIILAFISVILVSMESRSESAQITLFDDTVNIEKVYGKDSNSLPENENIIDLTKSQTEIKKENILKLKETEYETEPNDIEKQTHLPPPETQTSTRSTIDKKSLANARQIELNAAQMLYNIEKLPIIRPGVKTNMFSSYDRKGGNNDGFGGTWSKLRVENGNFVIAEMQGSGVITRMWFTHKRIERNGILEPGDEFIKIYTGNQNQPKIDVPLAHIFTGKAPGFILPIANYKAGGFYSYVPISYTNGCKVIVEGQSLGFYQLNYKNIENPTSYTKNNSNPFNLFAKKNKTEQNIAELTSKEYADEKTENLQKASRTWKLCGDLRAITETAELNQTAVKLDMRPFQSSTITLPPGRNIIRAVYLEGSPKQLEKAMQAQIGFAWEKDTNIAINMPVEFFFLQHGKPDIFRSLLAGAGGNGYYNFIPMPYRQKAKLTILARRAFQAKIRILTEKAENKLNNNFGQLYGKYNQQLPCKKGKNYTALQTKGNGKIIGVFLATCGQPAEGKYPIWLEGDDITNVDGRLAANGTGTEDFFNCGWYMVQERLDRPKTAPVSGFTVFETDPQTGQMKTAAYRWLINDAIRFDKNIKMQFEHGTGNSIKADYRSAVFYYLKQTAN